MNIILYSVFHKPFIQPASSFVQPIVVGNSQENDLPFQRDNIGDNISELNPFFCEQTAMYWLWKNAVRADIDAWGLCHYRRYFSLPQKRLFGKPKALISAKATQVNMDKYVSEALEQHIHLMLNQNEVILAEPIYISKKKGVSLSMEAHYRQDHMSEHWDELKKLILEMYPGYQESLGHFCMVKKMSFFNMAIAKWKVWDDYFNWLFPLLFELHNRLKLPNDAYQARAIGFISERLLNLFVWHNKISTAYLPVVVFDKK